MSITSIRSDDTNFDEWRDPPKEFSLLNVDFNLCGRSFSENNDQSYCNEPLSSCSGSKGEITLLAEKLQSMKLKSLKSESDLNFEKSVVEEDPEPLLISFENAEDEKCPVMLQSTSTDGEARDSDILTPELDPKIKGKRSSLYFQFDPCYETTVSDCSNISPFSADDSGRSKVESNIECMKTLAVGKKFYTEEQVQEILSKHKQAAEEKFLEKCKKNAVKQKTKEQEAALELFEISKRCQAYVMAKEEMINRSLHLKEKIKRLEDFNCKVKLENEMLKENIAKESQTYEELGKSFHEIYSRYDQSKNMIKSYQDNRESLEKQIELLQNRLKEQEVMNAECETKQEALISSHNAQLVNLKTSDEKEVAVLNAKLQRAELTVAGLENNINTLKLQNTELSAMYNDLVCKAGKC